MLKFVFAIIILLCIIVVKAYALPHESGEIQPPMALDKTSSFYIFRYMDKYHKIFNQNI